jgi:[ribosomal protein S5]-alanine N-acetyltransferase
MQLYNFTPFPLLRTSRLVLREISDADVVDLFEIRSNEEVMIYVGRPAAAAISEVQKLVDQIKEGVTNNKGITWGISLREDSTLIGTIGFWKMMPEHYRSEVGYMLNPDFQGKGYMHEALEEVIKYGFEELKLHSIEANVDPKNSRSISLLEKFNFIREGYFRESFFYNGQFLDAVIYSLVNFAK